MLNVCYYYSVFFFACQVVLEERIELSIQSYQDCVMPFNYKSSGLACRNRTHIREVEARCIIHYTKARYMAPGVGIEPTIAESKSVVLPLHYPGINLVAYLGNDPRTYALSTHCSTTELIGYMAYPQGLEPRTSGFGDQHSAN